MDFLRHNTIQIDGILGVYKMGYMNTLSCLKIWVTLLRLILIATFSNIRPACHIAYSVNITLLKSLHKWTRAGLFRRRVILLERYLLANMLVL